MDRITIGPNYREWWGNMENKLQKSGLYGLLFGLAVSILFVSYKDVQDLGNGSYETSYKPIYDYVVLILRIGIIGMFVGLFIGWKDYEKKSKTQRQGKTYYTLAFFAVFLASSVIMLIFNW
ncbi:hypothetical protein [Sporosarcina sp. G11-34]|uniref:hypothetical protein n=1 Tax=Sporosarcina sp. G11-34 TaxID=2849605 RepID=UPI0022A8F83B|nr:hypothetical protein [Sporosarcina sp. G11-34]